MYKNSDCDISGKPLLVRQPTLNDEPLKASTELDPRQSTKYLSQKTETSSELGEVAKW